MICEVVWESEGEDTVLSQGRRMLHRSTRLAVSQIMLVVITVIPVSLLLNSSHQFFRCLIHLTLSNLERTHVTYQSTQAPKHPSRAQSTAQKTPAPPLPSPQA